MFTVMLMREKAIELKLGKWLSHHSGIAYFMMLFAMPLLMLLAISVCATVTMLPLSLLMGWL